MKKKIILLVDDEELILKSLGRDLKTAGYDVITAENGESAIAKLGKKRFDLIITDLMMEGLDGIQVLKQAKKTEPELPVIILTGYGDITSAIEALRLGADDYLLKPCNVDELLLRAARCLKKQEAFLKVKLYENILPICMYCKSIRDDTGTEPGKGKWMRMEKYLHRKSSIDISHGCCPECFEKHMKKELGI